MGGTVAAATLAVATDRTLRSCSNGYRLGNNMKLLEYLASPGALTVSQLAERIGVKSDAQVRQWQHGYANRQPSPEYSVAIERATDGKVPRWELRPADWHLIWPELIGPDGKPRFPAANDTWDGAERRAG